MAVAVDDDVVVYSGWRGVRNTVGSIGFDKGDLEVAENTDIDDALIAHRRKGHSAPIIVGIDRDIYAAGSICLGVGSNVLKLVHEDLTMTDMVSGLTAGRALSYAPVAERMYYSNGVETGCVQNGAQRSWGLDAFAAPMSTVTGGALRPGRYQFAVTYLRNDDQESGARVAHVVSLTATGGITLTLPVSTDPTVDRKCVYVSDVDSEAYYLQAVLANAVTTFTIIERHRGALLMTQFLQAPPPSDHIAYANGRMLVSVDARIYPSVSYSPELFDLRKGWPVGDRITMIAPLKDGTWVGTRSSVVWLENAEPEKWVFEKKASYGVVPGTLAPGDGEVIGDGANKTPAVFFTTTRGLCAGLASGQLLNFTDGHVKYTAGQRGAGIVRLHDRGEETIAQYVVTMQG